MTHVTCRLPAKNREQLRNPTLGNVYGLPLPFTFLLIYLLIFYFILLHKRDGRYRSGQNVACQRFEEVEFGGARVEQRMKCPVVAELAAQKIDDMALSTRSDRLKACSRHMNSTQLEFANWSSKRMLSSGKFSTHWSSFTVNAPVGKNASRTPVQYSSVQIMCCEQAVTYS